jgi:hypothetical protein
VAPCLAIILAKNNIVVRSIEFGLMWNPSFGIVYCLVKTIFRYQFFVHGESNIDPWGYDCGYFVQLVGFAASIVIYPILTLLIEYNCCKRGTKRLKDDLVYPHEKDEDVLAEDQRV